MIHPLFIVLGFAFIPCWLFLFAFSFEHLLEWGTDRDSIFRRAVYFAIAFPLFVSGFVGLVLGAGALLGHGFGAF